MHVLPIVTFVCFICCVVFGYEFTSQAGRSERMIAIGNQSTDLLVSLLEAETGQRGYLITGNDGYLVPYQSGIAAIPPKVTALEKLLTHTPESQDIADLENLTKQKTVELQFTIDIRNEHGLVAVAEEVNKHLGKNLMEMIRKRIDNIQLYASLELRSGNYHTKIFARLSALFALLTLVCCARLASRNRNGC